MLLTQMLKNYHEYINANPDSLLTKLLIIVCLILRYLGLYAIKNAGCKTYFVVMLNFLRTDLPIHLKYNLKGATYKRRINSETWLTFILRFLS